MTLQVLLPLLIVLTGFSAFAGERESGTLRQVMSLGVSSRTLLLGKLLGTSAAVGLVALPAILIGVGVLTFGLPGDNAQAGQRDRKSTRLKSSHYCAARMPSSA